MTNQGPKTVTLGTLLSLSTGYLLTDMRDLHGALQHLAGGPVWTHQLPDALEALLPGGLG